MLGAPVAFAIGYATFVALAESSFRFAWDTHLRKFEDCIPFIPQHDYQGVVLTSWTTSGVYALVREPQTHVIDMIPSRRVYPMRGCDRQSKSAAPG